MNKAEELIAELRELVSESRDTEDPSFFHAIDSGAHLAAAFDELDTLLKQGGELPSDWTSER